MVYNGQKTTVSGVKGVMDMAYLGEEIKKLGFGLMRLPMKGEEVDLEQVKAMVDLFMEKGFTYFDTAWMYCGYQSESAVKPALTDRYPRDSYTLTTKLHADYIHSFEDRDKIFKAQLEKTGVDYFDYYLIHDVGPLHNQVYEQYDCYNWLREKKEFQNLKGLIYFTDGWGTFPAKKPDFETAFVFVDDGMNNYDMPPWAIKLVLQKEEI